ncbi:MAG: phosphohistidine phosphatase SixA [Sedimentisphaerales bacterium]
MKLYLVQHAKAVSKEIDPVQPLSEEAYKELQKVCNFIRPLNLFVDFLWHSGKKRAEQTAEILAKAISVKSQIIKRDDIGPNDDVMKIADDLTQSGYDIMIVGHLPFLGKLASLLLTGSEIKEIIEFKNAGIVCLSRGEGNKWQIEWIVTPQILECLVC